MKNILLMCSFGARADEPARASSGRAHEKFVAGDSGGGTVDEGTAAAAPTDSRSNANKRSPRRARHGGDSGDGSATAPFVIDTVARARYPLGLRWGMTARWGDLLGSPRALDARNCFPPQNSRSSGVRVRVFRWLSVRWRARTPARALGQPCVACILAWRRKLRHDRSRRRACGFDLPRIGPGGFKKGRFSVRLLCEGIGERGGEEEGYDGGGRPRRERVGA